jgi:site-specific DNA recombinase
MINILNKNNISFISIREQFDTTTPMGRAMMYIASVFAQLERETIAKELGITWSSLPKPEGGLGERRQQGINRSRCYLRQMRKQHRMYRLAAVPKRWT